MSLGAAKALHPNGYDLKAYCLAARSFAVYMLTAYNIQTVKSVQPMN